MVHCPLARGPPASSPGGGRHSPPEAGVGKDPNVRDGSPLGADPGSARDAQERERRPLASSPGGGRHSPPEAGVGKDPNVRDGSPLGADLWQRS